MPVMLLEQLRHLSVQLCALERLIRALQVTVLALQQKRRSMRVCLKVG